MVPRLVADVREVWVVALVECGFDEVCPAGDVILSVYGGIVVADVIMSCVLWGTVDAVDWVVSEDVIVDCGTVIGEKEPENSPSFLSLGVVDLSSLSAGIDVEGEVWMDLEPDATDVTLGDCGPVLFEDCPWTDAWVEEDRVVINVGYALVFLDGRIVSIEVTARVINVEAGTVRVVIPDVFDVIVRVVKADCECCTWDEADIFEVVVWGE